MPGMIVVLDTNVVVEANFWPRSTARRALTGLARRRLQTVVRLAERPSNNLFERDRMYRMLKGI
jgi:hypothetical protein